MVCLNLLEWPWVFVMPLPLSNEPCQLVFQGMLWKQILTYLDDLNVLGRSFKDHLGNLIQSFDRLRKYNLKLKLRKCIFFQNEVPFLGKLATTKGIGVDPKTIEAVINWPPPTDHRSRVLPGVCQLSLEPYQRICTIGLSSV